MGGRSVTARYLKLALRDFLIDAQAGVQIAMADA
jgi:hypothetical protein